MKGFSPGASSDRDAAVRGVFVFPKLFHPPDEICRDAKTIGTYLASISFPL